ncbi:hypothetical protein EJB05_01253, partial [Eragrostis curvula]
MTPPVQQGEASEKELKQYDESDPKSRTEERDWSLLGGDAVGLIADKLLANDVTEYIRLRAVCQAWRSSTADPSLLLPCFFPRNWLMLQDEEFEDSDEDEDADEDTVDETEAPAPEVRKSCFVNVRTGVTLWIRLPPVEEYGKVLAAGAEGLLILYCKRTDKVHLFNPVISAMAVLPGLADVPMAARSSTSFVTAGVIFDGEATVLLVVATRRRTAILYAKPGDRCWGTVDAGLLGGHRNPRPFDGGLCLDGQFYVATRHGDVLRVQLAPRPHLVYIARLHGPDECTCANPIGTYLVPSLDDNDGDMLLVFCYGFADESYVFGVHVGSGSFTPPLAVLGNRAIFLPSVTVRADKFPLVVPGTVYQLLLTMVFTDLLTVLAVDDVACPKGEHPMSDMYYTDSIKAAGVIE